MEIRLIFEYLFFYLEEIKVFLRFFFLFKFSLIYRFYGGIFGSYFINNVEVNNEGMMIL